MLKVPKLGDLKKLPLIEVQPARAETASWSIARGLTFSALLLSALASFAIAGKAGIDLARIPQGMDRTTLIEQKIENVDQFTATDLLLTWQMFETYGLEPRVHPQEYRLYLLRKKRLWWLLGFGGVGILFSIGLAATIRGGHSGSP
jgi:hypothetical protein